MEGFIESLDAWYRADCNSGLKDFGRKVEIVAGLKRFCRFAGYNEAGIENAIYGSWWFSQAVFESWHKPMKQANLRVCKTLIAHQDNKQ